MTRRMYPHKLRRAPAGAARRWRAWRLERAVRSLKSALQHDPAAPMLLLSPHWDDAVLSCWALLTAPHALEVVNVFGGVPARGRLTRWDRVTGASESAQRARQRIAEDCEALGMAGRRAVNLPLLDAEYREPEPEYSLRRLDRTLAQAVGPVSRVIAPAALGSNQDHRLLRRYARSLFLGGMPVSLFADLPYCITHGWPFWVDGSEPEPNRDVDAFWRSLIWDLPEIGDLRSGRVRRLDTETAAAKLEAMRAYRTQLPSLDGGPIRLLSNPAIHGFEVTWDLSRQ